MKQRILLGLVLVFAVFPLVASNIQYRYAVVRFENTTQFHDVLLKGDYLVVHDEAAMPIEGKACTRVYRYADGQIGTLVTSFRCHPEKAAEAKSFTVTTRAGNPSRTVTVVTGFQFTGEKESHQLQ
jgi:hypothetical protein